MHLGNNPLIVCEAHVTVLTFQTKSPGVTNESERDQKVKVEETLKALNKESREQNN